MASLNTATAMTIRPILLTGFAPFGPYDSNPSQTLVEQAQQHPPVPSLVCAILPVQQQGLRQRLHQLVQTHQPRAILSLGVAQTPTIRLERIATNKLDFRIPDNLGAQPRKSPIYSDAPASYHSSLPLDSFYKTLLKAGIPTSFSEDAGAYLCNLLFFETLHLLQTFPNTIGGFVHIPLTPAMAAAAILRNPDQTPPPSMTLPTTQQALLHMLQLL